MLCLLHDAEDLVNESPRNILRGPRQVKGFSSRSG